MMPALPNREPRLTAAPALIVLGCASLAALIWMPGGAADAASMQLERDLRPFVQVVAR